MGKTKRKERQYDDDEFGQRTGKKPVRTKRRESAKWKTLNNYVEIFDDDFELEDEIEIRHNKHTP